MSRREKVGAVLLVVAVWLAVGVGVVVIPARAAQGAASRPVLPASLSGCPPPNWTSKP